jgi:single-strand DNA-binding protein
MNGSDFTAAGNLTRDFDLRYSTNGTPFAKAGMAVSYRYKSGDDWQETTSFFDLVIWGEMAEHADESLHKGDRIVVVGRLDIRDWETDDGKKGRSAEVTVDEIAPSLRWATAKVAKVERSSGGDRASDRPAAGGMTL